MDVNFITVDPFIYNPGVQVCDWDVELEVNNPSPTDGFGNYLVNLITLLLKFQVLIIQ